MTRLSRRLESVISRAQNSLSKILDKVHLRYSKSSWRILQEFITCIPQGSPGKTATVLVVGRILQGIALMAEGSRLDGKAPETGAILQPGLLR